ncbi:hypothetical protein BofuT4_P094170.1 [Botrytis cinerea T4]|uniref:Uncharacterized protein n=1 Tax=Botryotinia fuckeliana (strain T4) TaxID=999810 RepID=G2YD61_BOTF4|nr:hypothetical protein BofuT4_P094170.1 [Botrytis cinerea T4]
MLQLCLSRAKVGEKRYTRRIIPRKNRDRNREALISKLQSLWASPVLHQSSHQFLRPLLLRYIKME